MVRELGLNFNSELGLVEGTRACSSPCSYL